VSFGESLANSLNHLYHVRIFAFASDCRS